MINGQARYQHPSENLLGVCAPFPEQTDVFVGKGTSIAMDECLVQQGDNLDGRDRQTCATKPRALGLIVFGFLVALATCTVGRVGAPTDTAVEPIERAVELVSKSSCDGDPCKMKPPGHTRKKKCGMTWGECMASSCCQDAGMQCYERDAYWAVCKGTCSTENDWSCQKKGKRDWLGAIPPMSSKNGFPSVFCFTFMTNTGHNVEILKGQVKRRLGIFACDEFLVIAGQEISLGTLPEKGVWKTNGVVQTTKIHTGAATGAKLFMKVWDAVEEDGRYRKHDWIVKTDIGTVLLPGRLRVHLKEKTFPGALQYIKNCDPGRGVKGRKLNDKVENNKKDKKEVVEDEKNEKEDDEESKETEDDEKVEKEVDDEKVKEADEDKKSGDEKDQKTEESAKVEKKKDHEKVKESEEDKKVEEEEDDKEDGEEDKVKNEKEKQDTEKKKREHKQKQQGLKKGKDVRETKEKKKKEEEKKKKNEMDNEKDEKEKKTKKEQDEKAETKIDKEMLETDVKVEKENARTMSGALEVFSQSAAERFLRDFRACKTKLMWEGWNENIFVQKCMDMFGVTIVHLYQSLNDARCKKITCRDEWTAAFHNDFNTTGSWMNCWYKAVR